MLLLANGTPMLLAGDELGNSQQGNNNSYCQDNPISWINWQDADEMLIEQTATLIQLRREITHLHQNRWWTENDVQWLKPDGNPLQDHDWHNGQHTLQIQLSSNWLLLLNTSHQPQTFTLPTGEWQTRFGNIEKTSHTATLTAVSVCVLQKIK